MSSFGFVNGQAVMEDDQFLLGTFIVFFDLDEKLEVLFSIKSTLQYLIDLDSPFLQRSNDGEVLLASDGGIQEYLGTLVGPTSFIIEALLKRYFIYE